MKRLFSVLLVLALVFLLTVSASAAQMPRLVDSADLLSADQEADLLARLDQVSGELQVDVVIVTMDSCGGYDPDDVVAAYYDDYGFGYGTNRDGVVLLLSMAERDWRILSNGFAADAITLNDIDRIGDSIVGDLSGGDYYEAFMTYATMCKQEIEDERQFDFDLSLGISIFIGLVVALIAVEVMRGGHRSVRSQTGAREYAVPGGLKVTYSNDLFLYRNVNRVHRPKETSSGSSFRGGGGGGRNIGGGKF